MKSSTALPNKLELYKKLTSVLLQHAAIGMNKFSNADKAALTHFQKRLTDVTDKIEICMLNEDIATFIQNHYKDEYAAIFKQKVINHLPQPNDTVDIIKSKLEGITHHLNPTSIAARASAKFHDYDHLFKVIIAGDSGIGKSCLLLRFVDDTYSESYISTIGVDFKVKTINRDDQVVKLQIWDTQGNSGSRLPHYLTDSNYRGAHAYIIAFDLTDSISFANAKQRLLECKQYVMNATYILVGTKCDLVSMRQVDAAEANALAAKQGCDYIEVSSKNSTNVNELFDQLADAMMAKKMKLTHQSSFNKAELLKLLQDPVWKQLTSVMSGAPAGFKQYIALLNDATIEDENQLLRAFKSEAANHSSEKIKWLLGEYSRDPQLRKIHYTIEKATGWSDVMNVIKKVYTVLKPQQDDELLNRYK